MTRLSAAKQYNATLLPVKFHTQSDAVLAVVSRQYSLKDVVGWGVAMDDDGECIIKTPKGTISAPLKVGQMISLASFGGLDYLPFDKMRLLVCHTTSSNFKKRRAILVEDIGNGVWGEQQVKLSGIVPLDAFSQACKDAVLSGDIALKPGKRNVDGLDSLLLNVSIGIVKCPFRLDHALALIKRMGNRDVYGDQLLGAIPFYADDGTHKPKWKLVYNISNDGTVKEGDVASIDHVSPKSKGGSDRLVNMQLMRKQDNSEKGNDEFDSLADPSATVEVLKLLSQGVLGASDEDEPSLDPEFAYDIMLLIRKEMKAAETTAKKFAKRYEQATGAISKQLEKTDKEKSSLRKKANAKKREARKTNEVPQTTNNRQPRRSHTASEEGGVSCPTGNTNEVLQEPVTAPAEAMSPKQASAISSSDDLSPTPKGAPRRRRTSPSGKTDKKTEQKPKTGASSDKTSRGKSKTEKSKHKKPSGKTTKNKRKKS